MNRLVLALVCAVMVWLAPTLAFAEDPWWECTATRRWVEGGKPKHGQSSGRVRATDENSAMVAILAKWHAYYSSPPKSEWTGLKCWKPKFSAAKVRSETGGYDKPYVPPPPIPKAQVAKPVSRTWTCRVKLRWHVGARYGDVDETWSDIEAPSESAAMGLAIFRSQSRLLALSLAGTKPAWSKTDAKCS